MSAKKIYIKKDNNYIQKSLRRRCAIDQNQERIKGTEKASPIYTLFHR